MNGAPYSGKKGNANRRVKNPLSDWEALQSIARELPEKRRGEIPAIRAS
jgi:hypothetical protein